MYSTVLPPKPRKIPGRHRKKRIRAIGEGDSSTRVSKLGLQASYSNYKKPGHNKASCIKPVVEQIPKPKGVIGRPRNKQPVDALEDVDILHRGPVRDESVGRSIGGARGSRGRGGVAGSRGGASVSKKAVGGSRGGSSMSGGASGSTCRDAGGSGGASGSRGRGVGGSKRKPFGLQDEPEKTQDEPHQTQHEPMQTQDGDQVEQTQEQAEIDLTQVEQT
ncbi:hypothetical protein Tco_1116397 [Tanacetum coccineum]